MGVRGGISPGRGILWTGFLWEGGGGVIPYMQTNTTILHRKDLNRINYRLLEDPMFDFSEKSNVSFT